MSSSPNIRLDIYFIMFDFLNNAINNNQTTDFHLPTDGIRISAISSDQFSLHWSPPNRCPFVTTYIITVIDCGVCPNITSDAFITCTNLVINGQICSITIQARACENGHKRSNDVKFSMLLKGK